MKSFLRLSTFLAVLLLVNGCASAPKQELQRARIAVAQAYAEQAPHYAEKEYRAASVALKDGETLVRRGDYELAVKALRYAQRRGLQAAEIARREKTEVEQERLEYYQDLVRLETPPAPAPEEPAREEIVPEPEPAVAPPAEPPPPIVRYTVENGETLWTIAARRDIYRDALLWPLIYKANRDQIKDPRQIYPGQELSIPRDVPPEEKDEARETARQSDIFPLELLIGNSPKQAQ